MTNDTIIIGEPTIAKLRAGETVEVRGVALIPASDLMRCARPEVARSGRLKAALAAWYSPSHHSIEERMQAALNAAVEPMAPEDMQEWLWHMDLHLTEHDEPHAGRALRAAWPHVRAYLASVENERNTWRELAKNAETIPSPRGTK